MVLSQQKYIKKVLEIFEMKRSKPVQTPLSAHFRLSSQQCLKTDVGRAEMVLIRPDLSHAVSVVNRYMVDLRKEHWKAIVWILRYLNSTMNYGLAYRADKGGEVNVEGFVDSDYAGDLDKRRSLPGYLFKLNGCTIS